MQSKHALVNRKTCYIFPFFGSITEIGNTVEKTTEKTSLETFFHFRKMISFVEHIKKTYYITFTPKQFSKHIIPYLQQNKVFELKKIIFFSEYFISNYLYLHLAFLRQFSLNIIY